jgi:hypothetical protein
MADMFDRKRRGLVEVKWCHDHRRSPCLSLRTIREYPKMACTVLRTAAASSRSHLGAHMFNFDIGRLAYGRQGQLHDALRLRSPTKTDVAAGRAVA